MPPRFAEGDSGGGRDRHLLEKASLRGSRLPDEVGSGPGRRGGRGAGIHRLLPSLVGEACPIGGGEFVMREDRPGEAHAVGPVVHRDHHQIHPPDSLVKHRARIPIGSGRPIGVHIRHDEVGADAVVEVGRTGIVDLPVVPQEEQLRIPPRVTPHAQVIPHPLDGVLEECRLRRKQGFSIEFPLGDRTEGAAGFGEPLKEDRGVRKHVIRLALQSDQVGPLTGKAIRAAQAIRRGAAVSAPPDNAPKSAKTVKVAGVRVRLLCIFKDRFRVAVERFGTKIVNP